MARETAAVVRTVRAIAPDEYSASANGPAIDRQGFANAELFVDVGDVEGSPTAFTVNLKLQDSADGSTGWADLPGAAIQQVSAANTQRTLSLNLAGARRYVRAVLTISFTGGTSPNVAVAAALVLGGSDVRPV